MRKIVGFVFILASILGILCAVFFILPKDNGDNRSGNTSQEVNQNIGNDTTNKAEDSGESDNSEESDNDSQKVDSGNGENGDELGDEPDSSGDNENGNEQDLGDDPPEEDPDDETGGEIVNSYSFEIYFGESLIYNNTTNNSFYSNKNSGDYNNYILKITANYDVGQVVFSDNVQVVLQTKSEQNIDIKFQILNGSVFSITIDSEINNFVCEEYIQPVYSYAINIPKGEIGITHNGDTITLLGTTTAMFQIVILYDDEIVEKTICSNDVVLNKLGVCLYFEVTQNCKINFFTQDNEYSFSINFIVQ